MKKFIKPLLLGLSVMAVMLLAWNLRFKAVQELPADYDEDDYLRAAQIFKRIINEGDWGELSQTNPTPEHPPLMKTILWLCHCRP